MNFQVQFRETTNKPVWETIAYPILDFNKYYSLEFPACPKNNGSSHSYHTVC